ncbi:hypothetical protein [Acinetobacter courvalinii]|uniref:hypothetical protein n=1 Tax=Acinetobacter courvalinii TaxID=280147 RepID=UPI0021D2545F|nr:hypothetical protein [Acinetobacter courvalinii]MCU4638577.1 hypothetical protein [Acinetobacter courvalinii]
MSSFYQMKLCKTTCINKHRVGENVVTWRLKVPYGNIVFLEKNKDIYPKIYERAQKICKNNSCEQAKYKNDSPEISSLYMNTILEMLLIRLEVFFLDKPLRKIIDQ